MDIKEMVSRSERIRSQINEYPVPIFYGSKVAPLKRMLNDFLVMFRELAWHVEALEDSKPKDK